MVSHLIDEAIRWTTAAVLTDKEAVTLLTTITVQWLQPYGAMQVLVTDREAGLVSEEVAQWLDWWSVQLKPKAPGEHAQIVERHHAILRALFVKVEAQLAAEGIAVPFAVIVAECTLAKNVLTTIGGFTPYTALYGRSPPMMADFEPGSETKLDDSSGGVEGYSRHHLRLREVAVQSMVELTAKQRLTRALNSKTRVATEQLELEVGDQVDFHRPSSTKDESGWRGPATVVDISQPVTIRWQGRHIQVRTADLRRALVYLVFLTRSVGDQSKVEPVEVLMTFAESVKDSMVRLGWLHNQGWRRARANEGRSEVLLALLHVAACGFHLRGCVSARIGSGISVLEGTADCDASFLWWWRAGHPKMSWYLEGPCITRLKLAELFGSERWRETSFVQFLCASEEDAQYIRQHEPDIPHVGGPYATGLTQPFKSDGGAPMDETEIMNYDNASPSPRPRAVSVDSSRSRSTRGGSSLRAPSDPSPRVSPAGSVRSRSPRSGHRPTLPVSSASSRDPKRPRPTSLNSNVSGRRPSVATRRGLPIEGSKTTTTDNDPTDETRAGETTKVQPRALTGAGLQDQTMITTTTTTTTKTNTIRLSTAAQSTLWITGVPRHSSQSAA